MYQATRSGTVGPGGPVAPPLETPYGPSCNPADAPDQITQAVSSLPPEQMFDLIKQMKEVIMVMKKTFRAGINVVIFNYDSDTFFRIIRLKLEICFYRILSSLMLFCRLKLLCE